LFDYEGKLISDLNDLASPGEPKITDLWYFENEYAYLKKRMDLIKSQPGWWANLPIITAGLEIFHLTKNLGYNCQILTKGPSSKPIAWKEKVEAIHNHFGSD